jgi:hypothetical protein
MINFLLRWLAPSVVLTRFFHVAKGGECDEI